jgi:hypothetical protein
MFLGSAVHVSSARFIVSLNAYDNRIYCYGKGDSATTVKATPEVSVYGDNVLIKGTVTDDSDSGSRDINGNLAVPLKGTPAISDKSVEAWMEYLFMDQGMPKDATGVPVKLETLDPNGNFYEIGNATSDASGNYACAFTPDVPEHIPSSPRSKALTLTTAHALKLS